MATKEISGSYPAGFYLKPVYSSLTIDATAMVGGSGVSTSASKAPTISNLGSVHGTTSGVSLAGGGTLGNGSSTNSSASIAGKSAIVATGGYASIFNAGSLTSDAVKTAKNGGTYTYEAPSVVLEAGGSFLNSTTSAQVSNGISISGARGASSIAARSGESTRELRTLTRCCRSFMMGHRSRWLPAGPS